MLARTKCKTIGDSSRVLIMIMKGKDCTMLGLKQFAKVFNAVAVRYVCVGNESRLPFPATNLALVSVRDFNDMSFCSATPSIVLTLVTSHPLLPLRLQFSISIVSNISSNLSLRCFQWLLTSASAKCLTLETPQCRNVILLSNRFLYDILQTLLDVLKILADRPDQSALFRSILDNYHLLSTT